MNDSPKDSDKKYKINLQITKKRYLPQQENKKLNTLSQKLLKNYVKCLMNL